MTYRCPPEMAEATRLTGAGKLADATALIQRWVGGRPAPESAGPGASTIIEGEAITLDAAAPQPASPAEGFAGRPETRPRTGLGATLRGLAARPRMRALNGGLPGPLRQAPEPLPEGASFVTRSYSSAAGTRAYKLYVPGNNRSGSASDADRRPLIVMLHGCTQGPDDFAAGTRMNLRAEAHGCLVAYPDQPTSANPQKCWNWFSPSDQRRGEGEPSLIAGITLQVIRDHPVDPTRVYIAGLSAGGAAAAIMGTAYPDVYAAVGVHSGLPAAAAHDLPSAFAAMRQGAEARGQRARVVPTIVFHGDQDTTVHPRNGEAVVAQSMAYAAGLRSTVQQGRASGGHAYRRTLHHDSSGRAICEQWTVHGAGHAWSGGSPSGSYTDPRGPDATREMLRFFLQHGPAVPTSR